MNEHAVWVEGTSPYKWESAKILSHSFFLRYQKELSAQKAKFDHLPAADTYIFGDFHYDLSEVRTALAKIPKNKNIFFHVYGEVIGRLQIFKALEEDFKKHKLKIVLGSRPSYEIAKSCVEETCLHYLPFTPDIDLSAYKKLKKKADHKFKLIYFGRISAFKSVHHLVKLFKIFSRDNPEFELHIAGRPDNFKWPNQPTASYFNFAGEAFAKELSSAQNEGHKVIYHGQLEKEVLFKLASSCDRYTSISCAPEEDFGLACYEALSMGLNATLSAWGGHKQYETVTGVDLVPIIHKDQTLSLDVEALFASWSSPLTSVKMRKTFTNYGRVQLPTSGSKISFKPAFSEISKNPKVHQEFFNHAPEALRPLWS